jgi:ligand-binding sensor domain-containing protein/signal transduction histidine kinase
MNRTLPSRRLYSIVILGSQMEQRATVFRIDQKPRVRQGPVRRLEFALSLIALLIIPLLATVCGESSGPGSLEPGIGPSATISTGPEVASAPSQDIQLQAAPLKPPIPEGNLRFEHISRQDGLSHSSVLCVVQDSLGFMWLCTEDGLNRYDGYDFEVYRHDPDDPDSLGVGEIWSVYEDQESMLWIWKYRGPLDRYDRKTGRFIHYDLFEPADPQGASSDFIWTLYEDSKGTLWAGTYRSGLHRYDRQADRFVAYRHDPNDPHSLSDDRVYAIYEDGNGVLWVGTRGGLNRFDPETGIFTAFRHDDGDPETPGSDIVQLIYEDRAGRFWITTYGVGLEQFDRQTGRIVARYQHDPLDPRSIGKTNAIEEIFEDSSGLLWLIHFDRRLDRFNPATGSFTRLRHESDDGTRIRFRQEPDDASGIRGSLSDNSVSFVTEDASGNLWIGTANGLDRYDDETGQFVHYSHDRSNPHSLSSSSLSGFYEDQAGVLWFVTSGNGLNLYDPQSAKFARYQLEATGADFESNNVVNAIFEDHAGNLWIGSDAGLNRFGLEAGQITHYRHDPSDPGSLSQGRVLSIYEDRDSRLWIGTRSGLDSLDRDTGYFTHHFQASSDDYDLSIGAVFSILQDRSGELWLGRNRYGLCRFDPETGECARYAYNPEDSLNPEDMIRHLYEDRDGTLWVGTQGGLLRFNPQTEVFTLYAHEPGNALSLSHQEVRSIHQDRSGRLWVATDGGGLNLFDPATETFTHLTDKDGLPSNIILGILEDSQDNLWLSTNDGLSRFNPDDSTFKNYDTGDGLQDSEFMIGAYHQNARGEMFFGGVNGFNAFDPADIQDNPYVAPVVLTSLTQGGVAVEPGTAVENLAEATFRWPNNFFEFEFAALSYSQPQKNQYAYRLEGFRDESWNYIGTKRFGRYTNLPGGTYTLRLKGSNNDGVWNETGTSLTITIVPPFWETWWFRGLALAVVALVGFGAFWQHTRSIRNRSRELEQQVASRTRELAALNAIAAVVSRSLDPQQILTGALDKTLEVTGLEAGGIYLLREEGILRIVAHKGLTTELVKEIDNLVVGEGFSGQVVQTGSPLVVDDLSTDPRLTRSALKADGFHFLVIVPVVSRAAALGTLFVMSRGPFEFTQQDIDLLSSIGVQIGVAIENARLFAAEQRRAEQFRLINQAGRELTLILDVTEVLNQVTRMIQEAFGYYHVGIGLIEGDEVVYRVGAGVLWDDPEFKYKPAHLKVGQEGLSGWVAASGEPLVVPDVNNDPRYVWLARSQTRSELVAPIMVKGEVIGVLDAQSDRLNAFDDTDLAVLQSLAHQVGAAIENARLYEQAQEAAVIAERSRIARDLHDAVTQTLFSASLIAEAVPAAWALDQKEGEQLLSELKALTRGALAEMRTLLLEMRPAGLVETSLGELVHQLTEAVTGRLGVPVSVRVDNDQPLPPDVHVALYRIAQEALNNMVKHSRASQAEVSLRTTTGPLDSERVVELQVRDDGRGFDPENVAADHLGLGIMRERAEAIGAQLQIESAIGQGTQISVVWRETLAEAGPSA